jgi:hypothetical protein
MGTDPTPAQPFEGLDLPGFQPADISTDGTYNQFLIIDIVPRRSKKAYLLKLRIILTD